MRCELQTDSWKNSNRFWDMYIKCIFINKVRLPLVPDGVDLPLNKMLGRMNRVFSTVVDFSEKEDAGRGYEGGWLKYFLR